MAKKISFKKGFGINSKTSIEFINIPLENDLLAFICPFLIANSTKRKLSRDIYSRMKVFLEKLNTDFIKTNDRVNGLKFLSHLHEPNEYHLGYSDVNKGKAINKSKAEKIFDALRNNRFAKKGISVTNEAHNVLLLVKGIGQDNMSDIIANVCRDLLAAYTEEQCIKHSIPLTEVTINYFNQTSKNWEDKTAQLPFYKKKRVIVVPDKMVCGDRQYSVHYNHFIASNYLSVDILNGRIPVKNEKRFVKQLKDGTKKAIIKEIEKVYGKPKSELIDFVLEYNDSLLKFQEYAKEHYPELDLSKVED